MAIWCSIDFETIPHKHFACCYAHNHGRRANITVAQHHLTPPPPATSTYQTTRHDTKVNLHSWFLIGGGGHRLILAAHQYCVDEQHTGQLPIAEMGAKWGLGGVDTQQNTIMIAWNSMICAWAVDCLRSRFYVLLRILSPESSYVLILYHGLSTIIIKAQHHLLRPSNSIQQQSITFRSVWFIKFVI